MKRFLNHRSNRWGYDGWALIVRGSRRPLYHTVSTTRAEAREIKRELHDLLDRELDVVKVQITVEVA